MRWALRLVALACLVFGVAYVGLINELIELHRTKLYHSGLRRQLLSYGLPLVGFCVAAFGFGTAASVSEAGPSVRSPEVDSNAR
jgi:hypothetical protein